MAARDLYCSEWFKKARAFVEAQNGNWYILSAKHGLLRPGKRISPYNVTLNDMSASKRKEWSKVVAIRLRSHCQKGTKVFLFAGSKYRTYLVPFLKAWGCKVKVPLARLGNGRQLSWFKKQLRTT
jgi:hypothetical protein